MSDYMEQRVEVAEDVCATCQYKYCRCEELVFTGRFDHEEHLQKWLRKAYQLRQACRATDHNKGKSLAMNLSTNLMVCTDCAEAWDLNDLVAPELRVRRIA